MKPSQVQLATENPKGIATLAPEKKEGTVGGGNVHT